MQDSLESRDIQSTHSSSDNHESPFTPHDEDDISRMLTAIGVTDIEELFDIPSSVRFEGEFGIEGLSEQAVKQRLQRILGNNADVTEFLGRGHYSHYVPSVVDHLSLRSEFITSYTQYQPEVSQGFLQVLFEFQSLVTELTGMDVANCSMYDAATALGEAATLADRVRDADGSTILVPDYLRSERRDVLENYTAGSELSIRELPTEGGMVRPGTLRSYLDDDTLLVYVENPTSEGVIEEHLTEIGSILDGEDSLLCIGSDLVALSLLQSPGQIGADIVVGSAGTLGLPSVYGMGIGIFACRDDFLRQMPGRLVGASRDSAGDRAYTLTLQTREQHIRRERATSNICSNQAWVALRSAIHATCLGPDGLASLADECTRLPARVASELDQIEGISAPVNDAYHFREFTAAIEDDATDVVSNMVEEGFAIHELDEETVQICVTETNEHRTDDLIEGFREVME
ncbi:glycine dehydrogenase (decarboxylating) alpha subunit [Halogranum amylolyticum]|uniref:Glycine dehydrogenase (Decarboxylating) alpha subunit n=1 Tax=Halogranum amylolyticum TaxID=660520 RepID=A0A1H8UD35_9EURY|nr:aminomethyl-transferring glycine dehydrogenase subunit GcvPA [Halogranum amylolyticum]SEP01016.1 glycine dehydrogenase (decarboxylating) alpha subunit [Halogranum amylolyticum]